MLFILAQQNAVGIFAGYASGIGFSFQYIFTKFDIGSQISGGAVSVEGKTYVSGGVSFKKVFHRMQAFDIYGVLGAGYYYVSDQYASWHAGFGAGVDWFFYQNLGVSLELIDGYTFSPGVFFVLPQIGIWYWF